MRAGNLRHEVDIQTPTRSVDAVGQETDSWGDLHSNVRAEVLTKGSREFTRITQTQSETTHLFKTRYRSGVTAEMRVLWNSVAYEIIGVQDPTGRRVELWIEAKRVV